MSEEHRTLVERATTGDQPAIEELLVQYLPGLEAFVRRHASELISERESTEDLAQSVCREVLEHLDDFVYEGRGQFVCWLHRVALNKLARRKRYYLAKKRDVGREVALPPRDEDDDCLPTLGDLSATFTTPSQILEKEEERAGLAAAFDQLSEEHQQVVFLAKIVELPHAEIAVHLGRSENACRQMLRRALLRLAVLMGADRERRREKEME